LPSSRLEGLAFLLVKALRISELAERGGVPATTVRYYEQLGLLSPAPRTADNHRRYDGDALTELRFVTQAKQLGLSLTEIRELVAIRRTGRCASVQARLAALVADKRGAVADRVRELGELGAELQVAAEHLESTPADGPCRDDCGCSPEVLRTDPAAADPAAAGPAGPIPVACTLSKSEQPQRMDEWARIARQATRREVGSSGLRLVFPLDAGLAAGLADLCTRELGCCGFFEFALQISGTELVLTVAGRPPADLIALLPSELSVTAQIAASDPLTVASTPSAHPKE